jgi:hypothetical protein
MRRAHFAEYAESVLIGIMLVSIFLVAQRYSIAVFRVGLGLLVASTFLQIAVGNVPKQLGFAQVVLRVVLILVFIAAMFGLGILLVPYLSQLGR